MTMACFFLSAAFLTAHMLLATASVGTEQRYHLRNQIRNGGHSRQRQILENGSIEESISCLLVEAGALRKDGKEETQFFCVFKENPDEMVALEGVPKEYFETNQDNIASAETVLTISYNPESVKGHALPKPFAMRVPPDSKLELSSPSKPGDRAEITNTRSRSLVQTSGQSDVLAIRVIDVNGEAPSKTAAEISDDIFGTSGDMFTLRSGYLKCSGGKLDFAPAKGKKIRDGVAEVKIPYSVVDQSFFVVQNWVIAEAPRVVGDLKQYRHIMLVFPKSVDDTYVGFAYYNWYLSMYYDYRISNLLVLMHEMGHNLNLYHSGEGNDQYGDGTCMMGAHVYQDDRPQMCFNGAKSWEFGWYSDRHVTVDPVVKSWNGKLVGVDDYVKKNKRWNDEFAVVVQIKSSTSSVLYLMYNRKKGINDEVTEKGNTVTVVEQNSSASKSWLLGAVTERTEEYRYSRWNRGNSDLVVKVCRRVRGSPDYANVLVFLDNGVGNLDCPTRTNDIIPNAVPKLPTTVQLSTSSGIDFYREKTGGKVSRGDSELELFGDDQKRHALRFRSNKRNSIPPRAVIISADILVYPTESSVDSSAPILGYAVGEAHGNSAGYQTGKKFLISRAPKTDAKVSISTMLKPWKAGFQKLLDVAPIVQEIVDRSDYSEGNAITVFLVGNSTTSSRSVQTLKSGNSPLLRVDYSLAPRVKLEPEIIATQGMLVALVGMVQGPVIQYLWDFGDGNKMTTSDKARVMHVYDRAGVFNIKLTVKTGDGETAQAVSVVLVSPKVKPKAILECPIEELHVSNVLAFNATESRGAISSYHWDFGDSEQRKTSSPLVFHKYKRPGQYKVTLKVKDKFGAKGSTTCTAYVRKWFEAEMVVSHAEDDFVEGYGGASDYTQETHRLFARGHELQAYRFRNVAIPHGATILEARFEVVPKGRKNSNQKLSVTVQGENSGYAKPLKPRPYQISKALRTNATVRLTNLSPWTTNQYNSLGDVTPVLQEIINHDQYKEGNAIKLFLSGDRLSAYRKIKTYESGEGAKLVVRFQR